MKILWGTMDSALKVIFSMPKIPGEGTLGHHGASKVIFSKYTANLKTWFLKKQWPMTNKHVNYGSIKCIYSITLPFDREHCAHILFSVINLRVKGLCHNQYGPCQNQ